MNKGHDICATRENCLRKVFPHTEQAFAGFDRGPKFEHIADYSDQ